MIENPFQALPHITRIVPTTVPNVLVVKWMRPDIGWGEITIEIALDVLSIDSEHMGPDFVKEVLGQLVDDAVTRRRFR